VKLQEMCAKFVDAEKGFFRIVVPVFNVREGGLRIG
jgi:hypothetical protein